MSETTEPEEKLCTLNVKAHTEKTYKITTSLNITVAEMKKKVEEASSISAELQRLIYAGQVLRDDAPLSQYGIQSGHTLHMVARAANAGRPANQSQPQPHPQPQPQPQQQQQQQQQPQQQQQQQLPQFNPQMFNMFQQQGQPFQGLDVNTMMGLLNNPLVQQSMNQLLQNPAMLQQMLQNNPMANQLMQNNPMVAQMLQNPDVLRQMANPQLLNQVLMAQGLGMQGQAGQQPGQQQEQQQQQQQQQMPNIDFAQLFGAMGGGVNMGQGFNMPQMQQQQGPQQSPEERFSIQLQQLQDMGFNNRQVNIQALTVTNGNVDAAVERILMG
jgi:ubiquilin